MSNWLQDIIDEVGALEDRLEDAKKHVGSNPNVNEEYENALKKVADAKGAINRIAGVFNKEYG